MKNSDNNTFMPTFLATQRKENVTKEDIIFFNVQFSKKIT